MKVLFFTKYSRKGASSRARSCQYVPYLKAHGIDVTVSPLLGDDYLRRLYSGKISHFITAIGSYVQRIIALLRSGRFDLLWIEYELFPWLPAWMEVIMNRVSIPYIVDYDDAIFHRYDLNPNKIVRTLLKGKIARVMRNARVVIVGNMYLTEYATCAGARKVKCIPTVVDLDRYCISYCNDKKDDSGFSVGWVGSPMTAKYLNLVKPALIRFFKKGDGSLSLVGSGQVELNGLPGNIYPWSEETEVEHIQNFDVGIMPLPDSPWERGKCGYKLIQYMACGKPVVASPVGVNTKIVQHGMNGFLADSPDQWLEALTILRDNPSLRKEMGAVGRKMVEERYCVQVTAPIVLSIIKESCD